MDALIIKYHDYLKVIKSLLGYESYVVFVDNFDEISGFEQVKFPNLKDNWYQRIAKSNSFDAFAIYLTCKTFYKNQIVPVEDKHIGSGSVVVSFPDQFSRDHFNRVKADLETLRKGIFENLAPLIKLKIVGNILYINKEPVAELNCVCVYLNDFIVKYLKYWFRIPNADSKGFRYKLKLIPYPLLSIDRKGRFLTETNLLLNKAYTLVEQLGLFKIVSSDGKIFYFDLTLLACQAGYFKTFFNTKLNNNLYEHRSEYSSSAIDYLQRLVYDITSDNEAEHLKILPEEYPLENFMELFGLISEYCIEDEVYGIELLFVFSKIFYELAEPLESIKQISTYPVPDDWITYKKYLEEFSRKLTLST